jgi:hypothetical protein
MSYKEHELAIEKFVLDVKELNPPVDGLTVSGGVVVVQQSCRLFQKGVRTISGFAKYEGFMKFEGYEIALKNRLDMLLDDREAKAAGLNKQVKFINASELRGFLVKLVNQSF